MRAILWKGSLFVIGVPRCVRDLARRVVNQLEPSQSVRHRYAERLTAISAASSASSWAVPMCSSTMSRPPRRSTIWTFVVPARPADFRTNTALGP